MFDEKNNKSIVTSPRLWLLLSRGERGFWKIIFTITPLLPVGKGGMGMRLEFLLQNNILPEFVLRVEQFFLFAKDFEKFGRHVPALF